MWRRVCLRLGYCRLLSFWNMRNLLVTVCVCFTFFHDISCCHWQLVTVHLSKYVTEDFTQHLYIHTIKQYFNPFLSHPFHSQNVLHFIFFPTSYSICSIMHKKLSQFLLSPTRTSAAFTFYLPLKSFLVSTSASGQCGVLARAGGQSHQWLGSRLPHCSAATAASRDCQSGIWLEL